MAKKDNSLGWLVGLGLLGGFAFLLMNNKDAKATTEQTQHATGENSPTKTQTYLIRYTFQAPASYDSLNFKLAELEFPGYPSIVEATNALFVYLGRPTITTEPGSPSLHIHQITLKI